MYLYVTTKNLKYLNKVVSYIDLLEDIEGVEIAEQVRTSLEHLLSQEGDEKVKTSLVLSMNMDIYKLMKSPIIKVFQEKGATNVTPFSFLYSHIYYLHCASLYLLDLD